MTASATSHSSDSHEAAYFADKAQFQQAAVIENVPVAKDTYRIRLACPELARLFTPGQFLMLRLADCDDPLLARPLALYDTVLDSADRPIGVDVVYLAMGKMTRRLSQCLPGHRLDIWGPLGNGFPAERVEHLIMVAGGIGQTPFMALAQECLGRHQYGDPPRTGANAARVTLCYGARSKAYFAGIEEFERLGVDVRLSTDDGSAGLHGLVTGLLTEVLNSTIPGANTANSPRADLIPRRIICCGPERMMSAVAGVARQANVPCLASLETPMACGIGICFSCVARIRDEVGNWDYRRTCVEGPIFEADRIEW